MELNKRLYFHTAFYNYPYFAASSPFIVILSGTPYRLCQLGIYNCCEAGLLSVAIFEIFDFGDLEKFKD